MDNRAENKHINLTLMSRLVLVLLLLAAVNRLHAQDDETASTATGRLSSQRLFRGVKQLGACAEGEFQVTRNGWRVDAEFSQPFDRDEPGEGNLSASCAWKSAERLKLEAVVMERWYSKVSPGVTKHSFEGGLSAKWTLANGFVMDLAGFHDARLKADTVEATLNYSMPLKSLGAYLEWSASIGTSKARDLLPDAAGLPVRDGYTYYAASVRLPYRICAQTTLAVGLHVSESDNQSRSWSPIGARGGAYAWIDLGLSSDF